MNKFSNDNLNNIKSLVEAETGVRMRRDSGHRIPARSLLIAALIVVLGTMTVFAAYQVSLSKKLLNAQPDVRTVTEADRGSEAEPGVEADAVAEPETLGGFMISRPFGEADDPITGSETFHEGIDIPMSIGIEVLAAASGTVADAGFDMEHGNYVLIEHEGGYTTLYGCLDEIRTNQGDQVKVGDVIGTVGSTGRSTGPHLHFELSLNGEPLDPADYWSDSEDSENDAVESGETETKASDAKDAGENISPEFKELVDSYEKIMYEYIEFLKTHDENGLEQDPDFLELHSKYIDIDKQLIEREKKGLNDEEQKYYQEVLDRVGEKYLDAGIAKG